MITGLDLTQTVDYTLKDDKENPTIWKLGMIPTYLFARISTEMVNKEVEVAYKILQIAIKGWENFSVPFKTEKEHIYGREIDVVPISILETLPLKVITELSVKVMEVNQLTEAERKNS